MAANGCASTNTATVTVTVNAVPDASGHLGAALGAGRRLGRLGERRRTTPARPRPGRCRAARSPAGQTTRQIVFDAGSPGTTMACTVVESSDGCRRRSREEHPGRLPRHAAVEHVPRLRQHGRAQRRHRRAAATATTAGPPSVTRAQMAVFLLKAEHGSSFVPALVRRASSPTCPAPRLCRRLDRRARRRGHHRRLRHGPTICPDHRRHAAPRWPSSSSRRSSAPTYVPPAATGTIFADVPHERLRRRLHRGPLRPRRHRRLPGTNPLRYCPQHQHPAADGGLRHQDVQPAVGRAGRHSGHNRPVYPERRRHPCALALLCSRFRRSR